VSAEERRRSAPAGTMAADRAELSQSIAEFEIERAAQVSDEIRAPFKAERATLDRLGVPTGAAVPGAPMPDARLVDVDGEEVGLGELIAGEPACIVLYRGAWCPYCNLALRAYESALAGPLREGCVRLVAISPQLPDGSLSMREANALSFAVLSDPGNQIARQLGVLWSPTEGTRISQAKLGIDLAELNADGGYELPMPTVVIVDATGAIAWIDVHPNYGTRSEPSAILEAVAALPV
jgi:peroxiredoxin